MDPDTPPHRDLSRQDGDRALASDDTEVTSVDERTRPPFRSAHAITAASEKP